MSYRKMLHTKKRKFQNTSTHDINTRGCSHVFLTLTHMSYPWKHTRKEEYRFTTEGTGIGRERKLLQLELTLLSKRRHRHADNTRGITQTLKRPAIPAHHHLPQSAAICGDAGTALGCRWCTSS